MTRSIILTNHKGGVGKSTSATNIALGLVNVLRHFGASNSRVRLIDSPIRSAGLPTTTPPSRSTLARRFRC